MRTPEVNTNDLPEDNINLAALPENAALVKHLRAELERHWNTKHKAIKQAR